MEAQKMNIDVISNNLANVNTSGYKRSRADFQELIYQDIRTPGTLSAEGTLIPSGIQLGLGVKPVAVQKIFLQGDFVQTGNIEFRILKKAWPNTPPFYSRTYTITPTTEKIDIDNDDRMARIWAIEFVSNEVGGNFILGRSQVVLSIGDQRPQPTQVIK
jgi:hypothetical protein